MQKIFKYIIFSFMLVVSGIANAQQAPGGEPKPKFQDKKQKQDTVKTFFFNSIRVELDVAPLVTSFLSSTGNYTYEGAIQASLKNKYYPIFEAGFAGSDHTSTTSDIRYTTSGPFGRIGIDFNLIKPAKNAKPTNNLFLAGVRLGYSNFNYNLYNVVITDDYWGVTQTYNYDNLNSHKFWFEVAAGIRVEIIKNIFMGWTARHKSMISKVDSGDFDPYYVPGFGVNSGTGNWSFNYCIGYKF
ncbi:MAG: DUF6048 family protein [Paludibacter sp.]|nr:DUF6048 family protein [Paludibacter sp.]